MFPQADFPDVLRGLSAPDDAAVLKIDDDNALVLTADFFAPIVDDPYEFGAIAAANALSDIYAMGARPILAKPCACPVGCIASATTATCCSSMCVTITA